MISVANKLHGYNLTRAHIQINLNKDVKLEQSSGKHKFSFRRSIASPFSPNPVLILSLREKGKRKNIIKIGLLSKSISRK